MSLLVWLPLNGNLNNLGLSNANFTNNGATVNANGKIGLCYSFNGSSNYLSATYNFYNINFSVSAWVYTTSTSATLTICCDRSSVGSGFSIFLIGGKLRIDAGGNNLLWTTNYTYPANTWFHLTVTHDGTNVKYYINGVFQKSKALALNSTYWGTITSIGASLANGSTYSNYLNGRLNDVRIYDHCLSNKEVEEIAKGLVLHYKLDDNPNTSENLMPNSLEMPLGSANASTGTWRTAGSNSMTKSRVAITDTPDGNGYGFQNSGILTPNDGSCYGIDSFPLDANTIYTISMWARITDGTEGYAGFNIYSSTDVIGSHSLIMKNYRVTTLPSDGAWTLCWLTFLTNSATTRNIYIGITTGDTNVTTLMCNVHIYKGIIFDKTIITDTSGFNNHGTIIGNVTTITPAPRYNYARHFDGASYIKNTAFNFNSNIWTISLWYLEPINPSAYECIFTYSKGDGSDANKKIAIFPNTGRIWYKGESGSSSISLLKINTWTNLIMTCNGTTVTIYQNAVSIGTFSASTALTDRTDLLLGAKPTAEDATSTSVYFKGALSDFRIYTTCFTLTQVKELYNISATVDKNGNIYAREWVE